MQRTPPIPRELWEQIPPHVRAVVEVILNEQGQRIVALEAQVVELQKQVRVLRERLSQTSQNSSKPPSSDGPHVERRLPKAPSGRKPGGRANASKREGNRGSGLLTVRSGWSMLPHLGKKQRRES